MKSSLVRGSSPMGAACAVLVGLRARRLAAEPIRSLLPQWAQVAVRTPDARWPELDEQYLLEIEDEDGCLGWFGPCSATTLQIIRDQVAATVIGADPGAYRSLARRGLLGRHRRGAALMVAVSAVRLASIDLLSRSTGRAVAALLGGPTRDAVPVYASALGIDIDHPVAAEVAEWLVGQGFYGQKWTLPGFSRGEEPGADMARLARLRQAAGDRHRIMIDALGAWSHDYAQRMLPALADARVAWIEEPVDMAQLRRFSQVAGRWSVPIAAGEHAYDPADQLGLLEPGTVDILQPEVAWQGGLVDTLGLVDLAQRSGLRVFPHGSCLPGALALAGLTDPEVLPALEYHLTVEPVRQRILTTPLTPQGGRLPVREAAGLVDSYDPVPDQAPVALAGRA